MPTDDYSALKSLAPAAHQLLDILGIVERALLLKAEIPALEKKKASLVAEIKTTMAESVRMAEGSRDESARITAGLDTLRQEHATLATQVAADEDARARHDAAEKERLSEDHKTLAAELVNTRSRIQAEVRDLERQKAVLTKSLKDLVASVPTG